MILQAIQFILGAVIALFLPGWLIVRIFFREFDKWEIVAFSIAFSIIIDVAIAIFLGYDEAQAAFTGGLNFKNILIAEAFILCLLAAGLVTANILRRKNGKKEK